MPSWADKDVRQYDHIKDSEEARGKTPEEAEEIAARTVNKHRRQDGRTPNKITQGTGNPNKSLVDRTVQELRNRAAQLKIAGRSKMNKRELIAAIRDHH